MSPNNIFITEDGSHSMLSKEHGVSYHSKHGAIQETQHVFINAAFHHKLPATSLSILDIGFGTGLNAYMTFLETKKMQIVVNYTAIEAYPISLDAARALNYSTLLKQNSPDDFLKLHELDWEKKHPISDFFIFTKNKKRLESLDFNNQFDLIYFDAFAPNSQPELWQENILRKMFEALKVGGVLTTYCAKGVVKRTFKKVGFAIEAIPGPPGKREMTRAIKI
ncbi:MAG TPA: SAM-dependent methyltransferase [Phaeodactylibacter sp.]|nr:SAM-dependent methyltransferase [Phaeodactylibacter sp.]